MGPHYGTPQYDLLLGIHEIPFFFFFIDKRKLSSVYSKPVLHELLPIVHSSGQELLVYSETCVSSSLTFQHLLAHRHHWPDLPPAQGYGQCEQHNPSGQSTGNKDGNKKFRQKSMHIFY